MKDIKASIFILILLLSLPAMAWAEKATGTFHAQKACEAYQSKNRKTNPGNISLEKGAKYPLLEVNKTQNPGWYKIEVPSAIPKARWVKASCGKAGNLLIASGGGGRDSKCQTAGQEDSYVFAVSWQPAFCEGHSGKPECAVTDPNVYQAKNFTLHGLWPNKQSCGTGYGFCGSIKKKLKSFCDYPMVPMSSSTYDELEVVMPSAAAGSCLQRHEWYKHGTCQTEWTADAYFDTAMGLLKDFNNGVAPFVDSNIGKSVSTVSFFKVIDEAFGKDAHQRMQISCFDNQLVDVYMALPENLPDNSSLKVLIQQSENKYSKPNKNCGASFKIDAIGQE